MYHPEYHLDRRPTRISGCGSRRSVGRTGSPARREELLEMPVVVAMRKRAKATPKVVAANQKAIDALPLGSGMWTVDGVMGLFVRCRAQSKSFLIQRRVHGKLVKETLGQMPVKQA